MWSGSIGSIPSGWYLCDGSNGTPNLTDRFIIGAGSTYAVNGTGGATSVTLVTANMPAHTHTATVTDPGHTHTLAFSAGSTMTGLGSSGASGWQGSNTGVNYITVSGTNSSTTGVTVSNASIGSGSSFSIIPSYYALAFIQKS
jgi:microcystin-dependent protein